MASAGRILIMPKGEWDAGREYEMLDLVGCDNHAWICKKPCVGIKPTAENKEYWHDLFGMPLNLISDDLIIKDYGVLLASNIYTALSAKKDANNSRFVRVINQLYSEDTINSLQLVEIKEGQEKVYNLFGEHNTDISNMVNGGSTWVTQNPNGADFIDCTLEIVSNDNNLTFVANVVNSTDVYVLGVNIIDITPTLVRIVVKLNRTIDEDLTISIGYFH